MVTDAGAFCEKEQCSKAERISLGGGSMFGWPYPHIASLRNASDPAIVEGDPAAFLGAALGPHDELIK